MVSYVPQWHPQVGLNPQQVWDETILTKCAFPGSEGVFIHLDCFWWWNWDCSASLGPVDSWSSDLGWGHLCPLHWRSGSPEVKRKRDKMLTAISRGFGDSFSFLCFSSYLLNYIWIPIYRYIYIYLFRNIPNIFHMWILGLLSAVPFLLLLCHLRCDPAVCLFEGSEIQPDPVQGSFSPPPPFNEPPCCGCACVVSKWAWLMKRGMLSTCSEFLGGESITHLEKRLKDGAIWIMIHSDQTWLL